MRKGFTLRSGYCCKQAITLNFTTYQPQAAGELDQRTARTALAPEVDRPLTARK